MGGMKPVPVPAPSPVSKVPRPYGLRCLFIGTNAAELEWVVSKYHRHNLLAELSWRNKALGAKAWDSSSKLISSGKCRKKNLTPGADYEFRVRAVEDLPGGLVGLRSDWSDSISIVLMPDKTTDACNSGEKLKRQNSYFSNKANLPDVAEEDINDNSLSRESIPMKATETKPPMEKLGSTNKLRRKSSFVSSISSMSGEEELLNSVDAHSHNSDSKFHRFDRLNPSKLDNSSKRPDSQSSVQSKRSVIETTDNTLHEMTKVKVEHDRARRVQQPKPNPIIDKVAWNFKGGRQSDGKASNLPDIKDDFEVE